MALTIDIQYVQAVRRHPTDNRLQYGYRVNEFINGLLESNSSLTWVYIEDAADLAHLHPWIDEAIDGVEE